MNRREAKPVLRTLIAENMEDDALLLVRELAKAGYDVTFKRVDNEADFRESLEHANWDILFTDYTMPGFSGPKALQIAHEQDPDMPVIVVSGTIGDEAAVQMMRAGAGDYFVKGKYGLLAPAVEREIAEAEVRRQHKKAETELAQSQRRLKDAIVAANIGLWDWHLPSNTVYYSREWKAMIGFEEDEIGSSFDEWENRVHPEDLPSITRKVERVIQKQQQNFKHEFRFRHKDGRYRWILAQGSTIAGDDGSVVRVTGSHVDITDRKLAEESIRDKTAQIELIFETLPIAMAFGDIERKLVRINPAFSRIFGYSADELIGDTSEKLYVNKDDFVEQGRRRFNTEAQDILAPYEVEYRRKNGETFIGETVGTTVRNSNDDVIGLVAMVQDLSLRKQAEQKLREKEIQLLQAQKMEAVGRLAAGVAHDFNNQLQIILGYCDMMLVKRNPEDPIWEPTTQILKAAIRARSTTSHLLSFSRRQVLEPESFNPAETLQEMQSPVSRMIGEDVQLLVFASDDVCPVHMDKDGFQQAIINLVVNARDAMPDGGILELNISNTELSSEEAAHYPEAQPGEYVLIEVKDSGLGMTKETLEHIFEPFFTTKEQGKGSGLGMPMVQGFLRQSGGYIGVHSSVGEGTSVKMLIPRHGASLMPNVSADSSESDPSADPSADHTILVVEDEEGVRTYLFRLFEAAGYRVLTADRPSSAIDLVVNKGFKPDLIVSDVIMPEMRGDELAARLKEHDSSLKILFISGYTEVKIVGHDIMRKPFKNRDLLLQVREMILRS